MKRLQLPFGVREYNPFECYNKIYVENTISQIFIANGYERISTSVFEFYELFDGVVDKSSMSRMFKMTDIDGSLLVLRPDTTVQACRMATSSFNNLSKYYYIENCFEYIPQAGSARTRQFSQIGLELFGDCGLDGDAEAIILAIEALLNVGLTDFLIEIGHSSFLNGILLESCFSDEILMKLKNYLNNKDALSIEMLFSDMNLNNDIKNILLELPLLFGDTSTLDRAESLCVNNVSLSAIAQLKKIASILKTYGYEKYISFDLSILKNSYYTGTVFRGIVSGQGLPILEGGRYDTLCRKFNSNLGAVGFAIGTDRLIKALNDQHITLKKPSCDIAYIVDGYMTTSIVNKIRTLINDGFIVIRLFFKEESYAVSYCADNGIKKLLVFNSDGQTIEKTVELQKSVKL